ncbi:f-actin-capping subunit alpha protein [Pleurostoma richardsiae]|uniref:F-actin-capping subunit alpha protein n=1 Tax=Pleurostoma richardsiae TaxID=41990 RepID=A0AA38R4B4_9PEZI|nr:f-actin-capping subunit alpha protein [Pleurostoma richardsiae]
MDYDEIAVMDATEDAGDKTGAGGTRVIERSPMKKTRSLSDGGGTPQKLSPSPHIIEAARRTSKDDTSLPGSTPVTTPVTPRRSEFPLRGSGFSLQMPPRASTPPAQQSSPYVKPAPLSPKLDHSQIYASPTTNILPRRSRGLDFSRAATSLHHSTLAEQSSPDSSPTMGGRAMNIPHRRGGEYGGTEQSSNSLWSVMANHDRMHISSSLGSTTNLGSDTSSTSDDDDLMDEDMMDEAYITTPQVTKTGTPMGVNSPHAAWAVGGGSPAVNSLLSFQQRQRPRKLPKKKVMGSHGLGFHPSTISSQNLSKSPPTNLASFGNIASTKEIQAPHARRESISWAANQLHISGSESDENMKSQIDVDGVLGPGADAQNRVIRRVVTRRGNLLPKTKTFARIRAALAEEGAPIEAEFRREAEVVRQVLESDMDLEPRIPPPALSTATTRHSSPNLTAQELRDDVPDEVMALDPSGLGLPGTFKQQALKNSKGKVFWDTFSDSSSMGGSRTTPPPAAFLPRGSSSGLSIDDVNMDSPSASSGPTAGGRDGFGKDGFIFPMNTGTSSSGGDTPQQGSGPASGSAAVPPSAAEITRRINSKRRRDDDFDPVSFKRRAVSPGMSVHNSPIMQSPLQHAPWGGSRPGSNGGDKSGGASESGSLVGDGGGNGKAGARAANSGHKARVGYQGMVDTNDGITRLSIE